MDSINGAEALKVLRADVPRLFEGILDVNPNISTRDGMLNPDNLKQYFRCGVEAVQICRNALAELGRDTLAIERIVDYACGYGRVLRFLRASYPGAEIIGADVDARALRHVENLLGEKTQLLDSAGSTPLASVGSVDLVWVGSLFTHLPERQVGKVLTDLRAFLKSEGVIVFTLHGEFVAQRIRRREKTYNLSDESCSALLEKYDKYGYGFAPYRENERYGISVCRKNRMKVLLDDRRLKLHSFLQKGWVNHQDIYAVSPDLAR